MFLGTISLKTAGKNLAVTSAKQLALLELKKDDPAGLFLGYDAGPGWFSLQCHTGDWIRFVTEAPPIRPNFPELIQAGVSPRSSVPTAFSQQFLSFDTKVVKLAFIGGTVGQAGVAAATADPPGAVALVLASGGYNSHCKCGFDISLSWLGGVKFELQVLVPGVAEIKKTRSAKGIDFSCLGSACIDFSGVDFDGIDFEGAIFRGTNLRKTRFTNCNLNGAVFISADLTGADFSQTSIAGADFTGQDFVQNGAKLPTSPFSDSVSKTTIFRNAKLPVAALGRDWSFCDFTGASIAGLATVDFDNLIVRYTTLPGLNLTGLTVQNADFSNSDLSESIFSFATFIGVKLRFTRLWGTIFTRATLKDPDFTGALLGGVDGKSAATLSWAYLENATLHRANLFGVSFTRATLFGAGTLITETVTMEQADFSRAYLAGVNLSGANLKGAKFHEACLVKADLSDADLGPAGSRGIASLAGAALQGVNFERARLADADLSNAAISFANGSLPVRYCNDKHTPNPTPPATRPTNFGPTFLDPDSFSSNTICPNGLTYAENLRREIPWQQMLTSATSPKDWLALSCGPSSEKGLE